MKAYKACLKREKGRSSSKKDGSLCAEGYCTAKSLYDTYPSAYANGYAEQVCEGKQPTFEETCKKKEKTGGGDKGRQKNNKNDGGLGEWFAQQWVNVCETRKDGTHPPCGRNTGDDHAKKERNYPYCRPKNRTKHLGSTKTAEEMTEKEKKEACREKRRHPHEKMEPITRKTGGKGAASRESHRSLRGGKDGDAPHCPDMHLVHKYNKMKSKQRQADYRGKKVTLYKPEPTDTGKKKLRVFVQDPDTGNIRKITFGDVDYADYTQHRNKERRQDYCARSKGIDCGKGDDEKKCPVTSANFWSRMVLWNC